MQNKKILLVDDEEVIRLSFKRELQHYYDVTIASCYNEALAALAANRFDLVITDLVMPGVNGLELVKHLKTCCPEIHVIVITAYGEIGAVLEAMRAGADDFLLKPCDIEVLLLRIGKTFERHDYTTRIELFAQMLATTADLVALVDENGHYLAANTAYRQAFAGNSEELTGRSLAGVVGRHQYDTKFAPQLARCFSGTAVQQLELFRLAGQEVRSMVVSYCPVLRGDATAVTSATITMTDVTDIFHDKIELQQREERLRLVQSVSPHGFMDCDLTTETIYYCPTWNRLLDYDPDALQKSGKSWPDLLHPEDNTPALRAYRDCLDGLTDGYDQEVRLQKADGTWRWFRIRGKVVERDGDGTPRRLIGLLNDIHATRETEQGFLREKKLLERNVSKQNEALARQNEELAEANSALTALLKKGGQDKNELDQRLSENVIKLIDPLVKRMHRTRLDDDQLQLLMEIEDHLQNITSSFVTKLTSEYAGLTPMEIQVATHVKQGKATKEIADILCLAPDTINVHRKKIRKKLGLSNKSVNLQTFLASLSEK